MLKNFFEINVYYFDTDCYNIVWHGAYIKWFEIGRVEFCREAGIDFEDLKAKQILLPVVNLSIKYKSPAKFGDTLVVKTNLDKLSRISIKLYHEIINKVNDKLVVTGYTEIVPTDFNGKLIKKLPDNIHMILLNTI